MAFALPILFIKDDHLIEHPAATYLARTAGDSMEGVGIFDHDLLVIDRALEPVQGDVIIVALDGELTCKILDKQRQRLLAANPRFPAIPILDEQSVVIEGVVKASIRYHRKASC